MTTINYRIHPAIGIARVGTSDDYYIAPETVAGLSTDNSETTGGLPIKANTESETITHIFAKMMFRCPGRLMSINAVCVGGIPVGGPGSPKTA